MGIVRSGIFIDQGNGESLAKQRLFVLDLEDRELVGVAIGQGETFFVGPWFVASFDAAISISIVDLPSFPRRFLGDAG